MFASDRAPVYSYSQPVHNTHNYNVFPNYPMNDALNTPPATSQQYPHLCSQDMMKHILQLKME